MDKRSVARVRRLAPMLETALADVPAAVELLVAEAEAGQLHPELWEQLHAAAARDDKEVELGSAYEQLPRGRRMKAIHPLTQARILTHGADFLQGILGDAEAAAQMLEHVIAVAPEHPDAFARLEQHYAATRRDRQCAELYARAAAANPDAHVLHIGRALALIETLPATEVVALDAAEGLVRVAGANLRVATVLEAHYKARGRAKEAAALLELAIASSPLSSPELMGVRERLVALHLATTPDAAMPHVEELLRLDPTHAEARKAASKLLEHGGVASRAAAALLEARRRAPQAPA